MQNWLIIWLLGLAISGAVAQQCSPYWTSTNTPIQPRDRRSVAVFDDGTGEKLYVSGTIIGQGLGVARWDGRTWEIITTMLPPLINAGGLHLLHDGEALRLYYWCDTGLPNGGNYLYWTGADWIPGPPGFTVPQLIGPRYSYHDGEQWLTFGLELVPPSRYHVLQWIDGQWVRRGGEFSGQPSRFAAYDDGSGLKLHVAGPFIYIDGVVYNRVAKWTGETWEPLGSGTSTSATSMIVHDDGNGPALYLTNIISAGGLQMNRLARWDGHTWSTVGGSILPVGIVTPHVLASFDDGDGPALFVGGFMSVMGGNVPVRNIARYKNGVWDDMGGGIRGGYPYTMTVFDDGRGPSLFVGGQFSTVGAGLAPAGHSLAQWVGCHNQCYADCDNSTVAPRLNVDDFTCFINKFAVGDPYVDCNQDGERDIDDFLCFITRFAEDCRP